MSEKLVEKVARAIARATVQAAEPEKYGRLSDAGIDALVENLAVKFYPEARAVLEALGQSSEVHAGPELEGTMRRAVFASTEHRYDLGQSSEGDVERACKRIFLDGHAEGWTGNQSRRDVQHIDAERGWNLYVANGALGKTLAALASTKPVEQEDGR